MPTPVGHAMAGVAVAWFAERWRPRQSSDTASLSVTRLAVICGVLGAAADLDLFFGSHRSFTHSLTFAVFVWIAAGLAARWLRLPALQTATICAAAYASHILLDWLGKDSSPPGGLMVWWPFVRTSYQSGLDLFAEVSRRYWNPREFLIGNFSSVAREVAILGPILVLAWMVRRRGFANDQRSA